MGLVTRYQVTEVGSRLVIIPTMKGTRFVDPVANFRTQPWWGTMSGWFDNRDKNITV